ncbi:MAG: 3-(cis-5,6-dihydroxycyclohexa-1,3-dien-1-yl)propanoate dehydrogenase [Thiohalomonadaceae bacterium]
MRLEGQVTYLTGGASGLGKAIAERFVEEGGSVVTLDRSADKLQVMKNNLGDAFIGVEGDVRCHESHKKAVDIAVKSFGKIDCVIPNAALWDFSKPLVDMSDDDLDIAFDEVMSVNVKGYLFAVKSALRELVRSKGTVIFSVSTSGFYAAGGGPLYVASKHAVVGLIRQLAFELAPHVRVNGIAPGGIGGSDIRGPQTLGMQETSITSIPLSDILSRVLPMREVPTAEEYAGAYVFLASRRDHAPATAAIINLDGGMGVRGLLEPSGGDDLPVKLGI